MELEITLGALKESTNPESSLELCEQIRTFFNNLIDFSLIDQYIELALAPGKNGIIDWIRSKLTVKLFEKAKVEALRIIICLLEKTAKNEDLKYYLSLQIIHIKDITNILWKNKSESSKIKETALDCLIVLFQTYDNLNPVDLDIPNIYRALLESSEKSTFTPSVRGKIFHFLGLIADYCFLHDPNSFIKDESYQTQLFNHLINTIVSNVDSNYKHVEVSIILGCIKGIDCFLKSFGKKLSEQNSPKWKIFYTKLEQLIDPKISIANDDQSVKLKRREFQRAGLELICNHGSLFQEKFYRFYKQWFEDILSWTKSSNFDDSRVGIKAMLHFLEILPEYITKEVQNNENESEHLNELVKYFIETFKATLDKVEAPRNELTIAIKGIGIFSAICPDANISNELFDKISQHVDGIITELEMTNADKYNSSLGLIPSYVESIGSMLFTMKISDEDSLQNFQNRLITVEQLIVLLFTFYPDLSERSREYAHFPILKVAKSLNTNHQKYFMPFFERAFAEGLSHIIASPTKVEMEIFLESIRRTEQEEGKNKKRMTRLGFKTVKYYTKLWINMMNSISEADISLNFYEILMQWTLNSIEKLDLTIEFKEEESEYLEDISADPIFNTKAKKIQDFQLFVNLVDFFQELIRKTKPEYFKPWIGTFINSSLDSIKVHSFVSGFYKLLGLSFEIARTTKYFQDRNVETEEIFKNCCNFLKSLLIKVRDFRDDLLLSVLDIWLSAPNEMIKENFDALEETLQIVFITGRSNFSLAAKGLDAIERWFEINEFEISDLKFLFQNLFPTLKSYFTSIVTESNIDQELKEGNVNKKISKSTFRQRKAMRISKEFKELDLKQIQLKILRILGTYGHFLNVDELVDNSLGLVVDEKFLRFSIAFPDIRPDIFLDHFIPRVLDICDKAAERQIRSAACEFLHTLMLYFLGYSLNKSESIELYSKMFTSIMNLACDVDILVRQLFNPLALQIVHWFTRDSTGIGLYFGETTLRLIINGLVQSENAPLRDFASVALLEFFNWSLKHNNDDQVRNVLKYLEALSKHASSQYRLGSVLGFNKIYVSFRNDKNKANDWSISLFSSYVNSLALSTEFNEDSLIIRSTVQAINHFERIFTYKKLKDLFNTEISSRIIPKGFEGSTRKHICNWLLKQAGRKESLCRKECIRLLTSISPHIRDITSVESFLNEYEKLNGEDAFVSIGEECLREKKIDLIDSLIVAADFFSFLSESNYPIVDKLFISEKSIFYVELSNCIDIDSNLENNSNSEKLLELCSLIENLFSNCLPLHLLNSILQLSLKISKSSHKTNLIPKLLRVWNLILDSGQVEFSIKDELKKIIKINLVDKRESEAILEAKWLLELVNDEQKIIKKILNFEEIEEMTDYFWKFINEKLYQRNKDIWESNQLSSRTSKLLEYLLLLNLALGFPGQKIFKSAFDKSKVVAVGSKAKHSLKKGEVFQNVFIKTFCHCPEMLDFVSLREKCKIEDLGQMVQNLLSTVKNDKALKTKFGPLLVENSLKIWNSLKLNCDSKIVCMIISGLASLDMKLCMKSPILSSSWCDQMNESQLTLKEMSEFIHFFGLFASPLNEDKSISDKVINAMRDFVKNLSNSNINWEENQIYFTKIFMNLLEAYAKIPQNLNLLEVLIKYSAVIAKFTEKSVCFIRFRSNLKEILESNKEKEFHLNIMEKVFENFSTKNSEVQNNLSLCNYILVPTFSMAMQKANEAFYLKNIGTIAKIIKNEPTNISEWNLKTIGFKLIKSLASSLGKRFLKIVSLDSSYDDNFNSYSQSDYSKKSDLVKELVTICKTFVSIPENKEEKVRESILLCNEAAYSALVYIIMETQTEEKFYINFILNEKHWPNIVDTKYKYHFPILLEFPKGANNANENEGVNSDPSQEINITQASRNLLSKRILLSESSLAINATQHDFTDSLRVATSTHFQNMLTTTLGIRNTNNQSGQKTNEKKLESREINNNECMEPLVEAIKKLNSYTADKDSDSTPNWIHTLDSALKKSTHDNIKAFLVGAILNCEEIFEKYSKLFFESIGRCIIEECFGNDLNHFVKDILLMLLGWTESNKTTPSQHIIKKILEFIIHKINDDSRKDVFENNLKILRAFISFWLKTESEESNFSSSIEPSDLLPHDLLLKKLDNSLPIGLAIIRSILFKEQLPCYYKDLPSFLALITNGFKSSSKYLYVLASETCGLFLKQLKRMNYESLNKAIEMSKKKLDNEKDRLQTFVIILSNIQKFYPPFGIDYKMKILELLRNSKVNVWGLLPLLFQEEFSTNSNNNKNEKQIADSFYFNLEGRSLFKSVCKTDFELENGVKLFATFIEKLGRDEGKILNLINWLEKAEISEVDVRINFANCLVKCYSIFKEEDDDEEEEDVVLGKRPIISKIEKIFIKLYSDENEKIQEIVSEFWKKNLTNWESSHHLIIELMETLADNTDSLKIAIDLVMARCSLSPEFHKNLFNEPLEDCQFQKFDIDTSWKLRNVSMNPLFAESLSSSQNFRNLPTTLQSTVINHSLGTAHRGMNLLKATLTLNQLVFSPTINQNEENSFQESMDVDGSNRFESQGLYDIQSYEDMVNEYNSMDDNNFNQESTGKRSYSEVATLKKKFFQRPKNVQSFFASREIARQKTQIESTVDRMKTRRIGVKLARNYRIGEIPDIQIKHSDLLTTIANLAKVDEVIGRYLLVHLFRSMIKEINDANTRRKFIYNTSLSFEKILRSPFTTLNPSFAATVVEISTENKIPIQPYLISNASKHFQLQKLAILKFEEDFDIIVEEPTIRSSKAPRTVQQQKFTNETDLWLRIAELYKDINDFDTIRNVFTHIAEKKDDFSDKANQARKALYNESCGNYSQALDIYDLLLCSESNNEEASELTVQFWEDSIYKCLEQLADWDKFYKRVHEGFLKINNNSADELDSELFNNPLFLGKILPNQIKGGAQLLIREGDDPESFENLYENIKKKSDEYNYVTEHYPLEISLIDAFYEEWQKCIPNMENTWNYILKSFSHFDLFANIQKRDLILKLQKASYFQDTLDWYRVYKQVSKVEEMTFKIISKWERYSSDKYIRLQDCDMIMAQNYYFLTKIDENISDIMIESKDHLSLEIQKLIFNQSLNALQLSIENRNQNVAFIYLEKTNNLSKNLDESLRFLWRKEYCRYLSSFKGVDGWVQMWASGWKKLENINPGNYGSLWSTQADLLFSLAKYLSKSTLKKSEERKIVNVLKLDSDRTEILEEVLSLGLDLIKNSHRKSDELDIVLTGEAYMQFYHLIKYTIDSNPEYNDDADLHKELLINLLYGMQSGIRESNTLFPTCFFILEKFKKLSKIFVENSAKIPTWMFLCWLDQIITNYKNGMSQQFDGIIKRLVEEYPQAFQLQYSDFLEKSNFEGLYKIYTKALKAVVVPSIYFSELKANLPVGPQMLRNRYKRLENDLLEAIKNTEIFGKIHTDFANDVYPRIQTDRQTLETLDSQSSQTNTIISTIRKNFSDCLKMSFKKVETKLSKSANLSLEYFSPWLSKFHFTGWNEEIEIPGLYFEFRNKAPNHNLHPKIVSFDPTVLLLSSKAKPIRIAMLANNGKRYRFLLKHGDDLRQDKRIQHLFLLSNEIFKEDPFCRQRLFNILSYSVIPINTEFGIIEWVEKTITLEEFMFRKAETRKYLDDSKDKYRNLLMAMGDKNTSQKTTTIMDIINKNSQRNKQEVIKIFKQITKMVPINLLKNTIRSSSNSYEEYFFIREKMIRSYAIMSLVHWLFGIGDRHLKNCKISLQTGQCLGIDFGYSFGTAVFSLPVPELTPFRLTPQIQNFLGPYGCDGLLKETMLFVWRAFTKSSELISRVVEAFAKEPFVEWQRNIKTTGNSNDGTFRIGIFKDKIKGVNPTKTLCSELDRLVNVAFIPSWKNVIKEGREDLFLKELLDDEELIDALISLAIDEGILSRAWIGWTSWI